MNAIASISALDTKTITCVIVGAVAGFVALQLTYALLAWALWTWLAFAIALGAYILTSTAAQLYMETSGYDIAVAATAKSIGFVKGLFA